MEKSAKVRIRYFIFIFNSIYMLAFSLNINNMNDYNRAESSIKLSGTC